MKNILYSLSINLINELFEMRSLTSLMYIFLAAILFSCGTEQQYSQIENKNEINQAIIPPSDIQCPTEIKNDGLRVLILGDDVLAQGKQCERFEAALATYLNTKNITNLSKTSYSQTIGKGIVNDFPNGNWDYVIVSGGYYDFVNCRDRNCLEQVNDIMVKSLINFVKKNDIKYEQLIFAYPSKLSPKVSGEVKRLINLGVGRNVKEFYKAVEQVFPGSRYLDLSEIIKPNDRDDWSDNGYHFNPNAYSRIAAGLINRGYIKTGNQHGNVLNSQGKKSMPTTSNSELKVFDDFSTRDLSGYILSGNRKSDVIAENYRFVNLDGNPALAITITDGLNGTEKTERAEIGIRLFDSMGKEVWYGFKVMVDPGFEYINDRMLFTQFKNHPSVYPPGPPISPLVGIRSLSEQSISLGGNYGSSNRLRLENGVTIKFPNAFSTTSKQLKKPSSVRKTDDTVELNSSFYPLFNSQNWTSYIIGVNMSDNLDGWVKIFQNGKKIYEYSGPTYQHSSKLQATDIRIGIYRDRVKGSAYPDQTLYFDNFAVAATKTEVEDFVR